MDVVLIPAHRGVVHDLLDMTEDRHPPIASPPERLRPAFAVISEGVVPPGVCLGITQGDTQVPSPVVGSAKHVGEVGTRRGWLLCAYALLGACHHAVVESGCGRSEV